MNVPSSRLAHNQELFPIFSPNPISHFRDSYTKRGPAAAVVIWPRSSLRHFENQREATISANNVCDRGYIPTSLPLLFRTHHPSRGSRLMYLSNHNCMWRHTIEQLIKVENLNIFYLLCTQIYLFLLRQLALSTKNHDISIKFSFLQRPQKIDKLSHLPQCFCQMSKQLVGFVKLVWPKM